MWGDTMKVQGLAPDGCALIWWMVGRQPFFQLEFFHHTKPALRTLPTGWRPCDHGWLRFGIFVPQFDANLAALVAHGIKPCGEMTDMEGRRRFAFIDPFVGAAVEIIEDLDTSAAGPAFAYATSSVSDLRLARAYYRDTLGLQIVSLDELHAPKHELLWGLPGARREGFLVRTNDRLLEIVRYDNPAGRRARASTAGFVCRSRRTATRRGAANCRFAFVRSSCVARNPRWRPNCRRNTPSSAASRWRLISVSCMKRYGRRCTTRSREVSRRVGPREAMSWCWMRCFRSRIPSGG